MLKRDMGTTTVTLDVDRVSYAVVVDREDIDNITVYYSTFYVHDERGLTEMDDVNAITSTPLSVEEMTTTIRDAVRDDA
jgi:hypothetical protein